ncbi:MAG: hypothetical protein K2X93_07820 [Candidatus Obscuribacterales bacterium]|nr:hypothetical protein [Candidatus Obscuribacterales bacterium]
MNVVSPLLSTPDLMRIAADHKNGAVSLTAIDERLLLELLKERGRDELDFGQELVIDSVKLVRRVTGNVSVFFGKV